MTKTTAGAVAALILAAAPAVAQDLPPQDAQPGECYAKVVVPAEFQVTTESVEVRPQTADLRTIPARYEMVEKQVLVQEESVELVTIPPVYETVTEQVLIEPERTVAEVLPPPIELSASACSSRPSGWSGSPAAARWSGSTGRPAKSCAAS